MITTVLIDLDGTLLPMDQHQFLEAYYNLFTTRCKKEGIDTSVALNALNRGINSMLNNGGEESNERRFWEAFRATISNEERDWATLFDQFYSIDFPKLQQVVKRTSVAKELIELLKEKKIRVVLATTPLFPRTATLQRVGWAGLKEEDFELITTYEEFTYAKPHLGYYQEIVAMLEVEPSNCLMIGNDIVEDMGVIEMGMKHYLVTDCLINRNSVDLSVYQKGSLEEALLFCNQIGR